MAAGLLGAGSVFLGPTGDTAQFLADALALGGGAAELDDDELRADRRIRGRDAARGRSARAGARPPGARDGDPRTPRLYELAAAEGLLGPHLRLLALVAEAQAEASGQHLTGQRRRAPAGRRCSTPACRCQPSGAWR